MPIFYPHTLDLPSRRADDEAVRQRARGLPEQPRCVWPVRRECPILAYEIEQALTYLTGPVRQRRPDSDCRRAGLPYSLQILEGPTPYGGRVLPVVLCVGHAQGLRDCAAEYALRLLPAAHHRRQT
jgi:hypothetical protein